MMRYKVNSSEFSSVGYDLSSSTLETEYQSGEVYQYFDVPKRLVLDMLEAESMGRFFNAHIRRKFPFKKIR
jgi:KTSC domain